MKDVQVAHRKNLVVSSQPLKQPFEKHRILAPATKIQESKKSHARIHDQILVDPYTGQLFMNAPGLELLFPMLVVRHGQTDGNRVRMFQGRVDNPLNEVGKEQVQRAAQQLYTQLEELFGAALAEFAQSGKLIILKSPLSRAQETANAFIAYFKSHTGIALDSRVEEKLAEICFGALEGLTMETIADEELRALALRYRTTQDATVDWKGTGESFLDVVMRANCLLEKLNTQYQHQDVMVIAFAHGMLINALRTVVGDKALLEENGRINFKKHEVNNAEAYWLGRSRQLAEKLCGSHTPPKN